MDVSTIRLEHKIAAVLACLRRVTTYEAAARQLGVTAEDVQEWEHSLLSAGGNGVKDRENSDLMVPEDGLPGKRRRLAIEKANAINLELRSILDVNLLLETALKALHESLGYIATIYLMQGSDLLVKQAAMPADGQLVFSGFRVPIADAPGSVQWVAANGAAHNAQPDDNDQAYSGSELAVPILTKGLVLGVLSVANRELNVFGPDDLDVLEVFTAQFCVTIENALQFETLRQRLTQLELRQNERAPSDNVSMAVRNASLYEQTQTQLREISQFRRLADEAIVGIMTRDVNGVIDYVNAAAAWLFGYPDAGVMRGLPMRDLYPDDTWYEVDQQHCVQALRDGGWVGETTQKRRDGQTIITEMSIFPIHAPDGTFTTYGTVIQDVTERQHFADLMQQANARSEAILQASADGIVAWDDSWRVVLANPAACRLLGTPLEQLLGHRLGETAAPAQLAQIARSREDERIELLGEQRRVVRCRNMRWQSDRASGHLTVIYDITGQVALEEEREELTQMLVHDLRGPLSSISTSLHLAKEAIADNSLDEVSEIVEIAIRSNDVLLKMTNSLLDIAKLETGELKPERTLIDIPTLFREVTTILSNAAQAAEIELVVTYADAMPPLLADHDLIGRALTNLLDNALKFTPDGGTVELRAERDGANGVRLSVLDTGSGIPEAFRQRIFEKYVQVPGQVGRRRGTGLGLAFCKLVAKAHHGRLWVQRRPQGGSIFTLSIPGLDVSL